MKENAKLTIIIPVFNGEKTIKSCITSIIKQTYTDLEIVIIDDAWEDKTYEICLSFAERDNRIILYRQENKGVSAARNKGIDAASGKYVMFVDADDRLDDSYFESFMNHSDMTNNGVMVVGLVKTYYNGDEIIDGSDFPTDIILDKDRLVDIWDKHIWNSPFNKLFILEVIKKNKIRFDEKYKIGEDWLFNNAYVRALSPSGYYIPSNTYYYYYCDLDPWRHCKKEEFYYINKSQVEDFKSTILLLGLSDKSRLKFEKRDIDFTISEIRRIVRNGEKIEKAKKLLVGERISFRLKEHKTEYSKMDIIEFSSGSILLVFILENIRKILGKVKKLHG